MGKYSFIAKQYTGKYGHSCKAMRDVIKAIAKASDGDWREYGWHITLNRPSMMRLCIERVADNLISVAHYYELNGDLVSDPDIVFYDKPFVDADGSLHPELDVFTPVSYQDAMRYDECILFDEDGKPMSGRPALSRSIGTFANQWAKNIRAQKFVEAAKKVKEES